MIKYIYYHQKIEWHSTAQKIDSDVWVASFLQTIFLNAFLITLNLKSKTTKAISIDRKFVQIGEMGSTILKTNKKKENELKALMKTK